MRWQFRYGKPSQLSRRRNFNYCLDALQHEGDGRRWKKMVRAAGIVSPISLLILDSRSLSRYIVFQTCIVERNREIEKERGGLSWRKVRWIRWRLKLRGTTGGLVNRHGSIARRLLLFDGPFCISRFALPFARGNRQGHAFFAPR